MTPKKSIKRTIQATLYILLCTLILLTGCSKEQVPESQGSTPTVEPSLPTETNKNNTVEQSNPPTNSTVSDTTGIPEGVKIKKVIKEENLKNDYRKKVERLTDGGKRITITKSNGELIMLNIEYDGIILTASGNQVTVQVEDGGEQSLTIPKEIDIEDDEMLGLNKGVEIEWTLDADGKITSVELDD